MAEREWLAWQIGITKGTANEKVRAARALEHLPLISEAMAKGELSFSKVRALTRAAVPENEAELLEFARAGSAANLERLVRGWKTLSRFDEAQQERIRHSRRCFSIFPDEDGMYVVKGRLDPEVGAALMRAVEAASDALFAADASVLDVGRKTRTIPPSLRRALDARDRGCRFPGCGLRFTDAHHIVHWANGGETKLGNTVLLCRSHHRRVHEGGYRVCSDRSGQVVFFTPKGNALFEASSRPELPVDPVGVLVRRNRERGVTPSFWSGAPKWKKDWDIPWAIEAAAREAVDPSVGERSVKELPVHERSVNESSLTELSVQERSTHPSSFASVSAEIGTGSMGPTRPSAPPPEGFWLHVGPRRAPPPPTLPRTEPVCLRR